jgi:hypothetical protein|tara:strand:- start:1211 stop:2185 length:975 start_codon:yes stop_codon:yes gene_type:complete
MNKKITNTLSENATLVRLTAKHPSGLKVDRSLRNALAKKNSVSDPKLLHVSKHMFGMNVNSYFRRILNQFRNNYYYPLTVAWSDNSTDDEGHTVSGWRLCPNSNLEKLQVEVDAAKIDYFREVKTFVKNYPDILEGAKRNLGATFKSDNYPSIEELERKFKFDFELSMVPQFGDDIRLNVSEKLRERIENAAVSRANNNIKSIFIATVEALVEQVDHVSTKLDEYDPKGKSKNFFNKSSFDKLRQAVDMLPSINSDILGNNPTVRNAHQKLVSVFATINEIETLRDDTEVGQTKRKQVADDLKGAVGGLKGGFLDKAFGGSKHD